MSGKCKFVNRKIFFIWFSLSLTFHSVVSPICSISDLRVRLFSCATKTGKSLPKLVSSPATNYPKQHWLGACLGRGAVSSSVNCGEVFYDGAVIETDVRILMAMTWGTKSSSLVRTIYPDLLDEGLQEAAEKYCQTQVAIKGGSSVVLPTLLSWFRSDFGKSPESVLRRIQNFLSEDQKLQIQKSHQSGDLRIVFGAVCPSDWRCGLSSSSNVAFSGNTFSAEAKKNLVSATKPMKREIAPMESIADFSLYT